MNRIPIVIDCDPGVDDSYAIAMANAFEGFDIKAITPVAGNVIFEKTSRNALALAEMLNIDCRVAKGADKPLVRPYKREASATHGASGVGTVVFPPATREYDEKEAWDVIYEEAVKAEGKLILFAIGPLTNIAITLRKYPDLPKLIDKFVIMGGGTMGNVNPYAEFNIWEDSVAAREVFEKMEVYMVGLNATHAATISSQDFVDMIELSGEGEHAYLIRELSKFSKYNSEVNGSDSNVIHDALAVASIINDKVVTYEDCYCFVEDDENAPNDGETVVDFEGKYGKPVNCHIAMKVDKDLFVGMLKDTVKFYADKDKA